MIRINCEATDFFKLVFKILTLKKNENFFPIYLNFHLSTILFPFNLLKQTLSNIPRHNRKILML